MINGLTMLLIFVLIWLCAYSFYNLKQARENRQYCEVFDEAWSRDVYLMNVYQFQASRTLNCNLDTNEKLKMLAMGLSGEAGEIVDLLKKHLYHGYEWDEQKIKKELGDLLFYLSGVALVLDIKLSDVAKTNIEKLQKRYPDGFVKGGGIRDENER